VTPAASKSSGVDTRAAAPSSCLYVPNEETALMPANANRPIAGIVVLDLVDSRS
jgi:hypothetical protein